MYDIFDFYKCFYNNVYFKKTTYLFNNRQIFNGAELEHRKNSVNLWPSDIQHELKKTANAQEKLEHINRNKSQLLCEDK